MGGCSSKPGATAAVQQPAARFTPAEDDRTAVGNDAVTVDEAALAAALMAGQKLFTNLQLSISCRALRNKDKDRGSLSDPFAVVYLQSDDRKTWMEVGRTEVVANTLDPQFVKLVNTTYHFEKVQRLRVEIYDLDSAFTAAEGTEQFKLSEQDYQGYIEVAIPEIIAKSAQRWEGAILRNDSTAAAGAHGYVTIAASEVPNSSSLVEIDVAGEGMPAGCSPFLVLSRVAEGGGAPTRCYKTEAAPKGGTAKWARISVPLSSLANGDASRPLLIECYAHHASGRHARIGAAALSVNAIRAHAVERTHLFLSSASAEQTTPAEHTSAAQQQAAPRLVFGACALAPRPSFFDYLAGGCALNFVVAVDYTPSNRVPSDPRSLHYRHPDGTLSQYAAAIQGVGGVLEYYDTDKMYPVYGFGAVPPYQPAGTHRSMCFAITGNEQNPEVHGVQGLLEAYHESLPHIQFTGPTYFAPVIHRARELASESEGAKQQYWVLLLMTDGLIGDMDATVDAIIQASGTPLSVIIVGVGGADFGAMHVLDADGTRLKSKRLRREAARDIVQFVPMKDFVGRGAEELAREVLAEVPRQLLQHFKARGILPGTGNGLAAAR